MSLKPKTEEVLAKAIFLLAVLLVVTTIFVVGTLTVLGVIELFKFLFA